MIQQSIALKALAEYGEVEVSVLIETSILQTRVSVMKTQYLFIGTPRVFVQSHLAHIPACVDKELAKQFLVADKTFHEDLTAWLKKTIFDWLDVINEARDNLAAYLPPPDSPPPPYPKVDDDFQDTVPGDLT